MAFPPLRPRQCLESIILAKCRRPSCHSGGHALRGALGICFCFHYASEKQIPRFARNDNFTCSTGLQLRTLGCGHNRALGRGILRHRRNFSQGQSSHKHGRGGDASPAIEFPSSAEKTHFGAQGKIEYHFGSAAIELLRNFQIRFLAEVLAIRGTPNRNFEGLLLNLLGESKLAKESARGGGGDIEGLPITVGFKFGLRWDDSKFEGHRVAPSLV